MYPSSSTSTESLAGFHVSRDARDFYQFLETFFAYRGKAQIPNFQAARGFADQLNGRRDSAGQFVMPSAVNAVALIHGITHSLFRQYCARRPGVLSTALNRVQEQLGNAADQTLDTFLTKFPPQPIYHRQMSPYDYITTLLDGRPNRETTIEELLMLWLSNANPAFRPFFELFGDSTLRETTAYSQLTAELNRFFGSIAASDTGDGQFPTGENILDLLLAPVRAAPDSLDQQLQIFLNTWSGVLDSSLIYRAMTVIDTLKEDHRFLFFGPVGVPIDTVSGKDMQIASFADYQAASYNAAGEPEIEAFTPDREWMPNLVMIAKNAYVWLDQLSKRYGTELTRLDQIPDSELDQLARWGFTGLWLIGLWERSTASQRIKHLCSNPDAVASAYSLYDYSIAARLGGEAALNDLRERAWKRGIRLASDMVPNHFGIDSKWVSEHPEYFLSSEYSPYPNYTFNGPDLSNDPRIELKIEDHYYDRTDAAVVFRRVDRHTGETRYVYHGNDGTTMPWNDTAQLNYLSPVVREAMIQLIIDIAKRFPVIRFDAAMTLVKRHVQRLWFPEPGTGSGIASRAVHGLIKPVFDQQMPEEFWREVVDRVAIEAPDTLLLAEAFWLMESYFVRTLGMHRVYNSAFMNILRDEENAKYRRLMRDTLEFDPEILRRWVNFLNNPDEKTAAEQFGKGDKYFGICMLMLTTPGLPMFGHGQVEGFTEKYGMEYYRAYYDETPDQWLINRHERDLFPLSKRRYLFAGVDHYQLYDFITEGGLNENVYAYSNRKGEERTICFYNNRMDNTAGWIKGSVPFSVKVDGQEERVMITRTLGEGLNFPTTQLDDLFVIFKEHRSGLEYIRPVRELWERGLYVQLQGYEFMVFWEFRFVQDTAGHYRRVYESLGGRGMTNIGEAFQELVMEPILTPFRALITADSLKFMVSDELDTKRETDIHEKAVAFAEAAAKFLGVAAPEVPFHPKEVFDEELEAELEEEDMLVYLESLTGNADDDATEVDESGYDTLADEESILTISPALLDFLTETDSDLTYRYALEVFYLLESCLGDDLLQTRAWIDEWLLGKHVLTIFREVGIAERQASQAVALVKFLTARQSLLAGTPKETAERLLYSVLGDSDARQLLGVNTYAGVTYYDQWGFAALLSVLELGSEDEALEARYKSLNTLFTAHQKAEYLVEKLRAGVTP
jgi:glycosidase